MKASATGRPIARDHLTALRDELDSARLYEILSTLESNPRLAEVYRRLAAVEWRHADAWTRQLREAGEEVPPYRPSARTRVLIWLARRFGIGFILPSLASLEEIHGHEYLQAADATAAQMAGDERARTRGCFGECRRRPVGWKEAQSRNWKADTGPPEATPCAPQCWEPTTGSSQTSAW